MHRMAEVIGRMEEREKNHEATLVAMEKEMALKQQAMDAFRLKVRGQVFEVLVRALLCVCVCAGTGEPPDSSEP